MLKQLRAIIYSGIGSRGLRMGRFGKAAAHFSEVIRLFPNNPAAYVNRSVAFQGMDDHRRALDDLDRAIGLDSRLAIAHFNRGISWKFLGDFDRAGADQMQARALAPRRSDPHGELGVLAYLRHDFDVSISHFTSAIKLAPRDAGHYKGRGWSYFSRGNFTAAEADLRYSFNLGALGPPAGARWCASRNIAFAVRVGFVRGAPLVCVRLTRSRLLFPRSFGSGRGSVSRIERISSARYCWHNHTD